MKKSTTRISIFWSILLAALLLLALGMASAQAAAPTLTGTIVDDSNNPISLDGSSSVAFSYGPDATPTAKQYRVQLHVSVPADVTDAELTIELAQGMQFRGNMSQLQGVTQTGAEPLPSPPRTPFLV